MQNTSEAKSFNLFKTLNMIKHFWRKLNKQENDGSLRETIEELIEESNESEPSIESDERALLGNVLNLRDLTAYDVMIPRADIIAAPYDIKGPDLVAMMTKSGLTRLPIYRETLDNVIGMVHIKNVLGWLANKKPFKIKQLINDVLFISPSMRTLDLLLQMRETGSKMAMVVDEYGGVDGLVTFSNLIEEIIGDIQDAHDHSPPSQIEVRGDGTIIADGRVMVEELNKILGENLQLTEVDEDIDTIGGIVIFLAGRVPIRGELIRHGSGIEFEVLDADPRRVKRLCLRQPSASSIPSGLDSTPSKKRAE